MKHKTIQVLGVTILLASFLLSACGNREADRQGAIAAKACAALKEVMGIDTLAGDHRKPGVFYIGPHSRMWTTATIDHAQIPTPTLIHRKIKIYHKPMEAIGYSDRQADIYILIFIRHVDARKYLQQFVKPQFVKKYGSRPMFSYLEEALGVYTHGYCDMKNPEQSVAMFMAGVAHLSQRAPKAFVYRLNRPRALLLVAATPKPTELNLFFPAKDPEAITYEHIMGPNEFITSLVGSLSRQ